MSMKVEVDLLDAQMLSVLTSAAAKISQEWDVTLLNGLSLHITLSCKPHNDIPQSRIDQVNACIGELIKIARSDKGDKA